DLVMFRPPDAPVFDMAKERDYIGGGGLQPYESMLKRLVAIGGDTVIIDDAGVVVNGSRLENTAPLATDLAGRPLPVCKLAGYRLNSGEVLVVSDYSPLSFD